MNKAAKIAGIIITAFIVLVYLLSSVASYLPPEKFPDASILSLIYLPILVVYAITVFAWLFIRKKIALLLFLLLFVGYRNLTATVSFNAFSSSWKKEKDSNSLRVMCWNVNFMGDHWIMNDTPGNVRRKMLDQIKEVQPDILCLQDFTTVENGWSGESFRNAVNDVINYGRFSNYHFAFIYEWNATNYCVKTGTAIFSKYPIADTGSFVTGGQLPGERAAFADILFQKKKFRVYAAHLSSMSLWPNKQGEAGLSYLEGDSTTKRTSTIITKLKHYGKMHSHEANIIKNEMNKSPYPYFLSADLNAVPSDHVYHMLREGLKDAFIENDLGIGGTYHLVFPKLRIDVFLYSKELEATQYTRPAVNLSDHYPIITDIRWKK